MKLSKNLMSGILVLGLAPAAYAGNGGGDPFNFLFIDAGARSAAMGGAYTALANDSNALQYNPGGLGMQPRYEGTFMHNVHIQGVSQDYIALTAPLDAGGMHHGFGVEMNYLHYADNSRTTYASPNGDGSNFGINDLAVSAGYGVTLIPNVSLGGAFKYLRESIDNGSMAGYVFDLGGLFTVPSVPKLSLGLALQNAGPDQKFQKISNNPGREHMPLNVRGGAAYGFTVANVDATLAADVSKERTANAVFGFGAEAIIMKSLAARIGYNSTNGAGPGISAGVGWVAPSFGIDYAVVPYGDLGYSNRVSVTYRWGQSSGKMTGSNAKPKADLAGLQSILPASRPN